MPMPKIKGYTLEDWARMERKEPDWIIGEWLKRHNTAFMIGEPKKANKSWMLLAMLWDLSEGKAVWGTKHPRRPKFFRPPRPMRCVYFAQEDSEDDILDRLAVNFGWRETNRNLMIVPKNWAFLLDTATGTTLIHNILQSHAPVDLIVFDTYRRVMGGSENDSVAIAQMYKHVDELSQIYGTAAIFAHHPKKPPTKDDETFDYSDPFIGRGSGDIFGGGDAFITVKPEFMDEKGARVTLFFMSKRAATVAPMTVDIDYTTGECKFVKFNEERK